MNGLTRKLLLTQLLTHVILLLCIVVFGIITAPGDMESEFLGTWYVANSIIVYLEYFIPITATALLITFSIQIRNEDIPAEQSFFKIIQSALVFLLFALVAYTVLILLLLPRSYQNRAEAEFKSDYVTLRMDQAEDLFINGKLNDARMIIDEVINIVPQEPRVIELYWDIHDELPAAQREEGAPSAAPELPQNMSFGEILDRAELYFEENDWFSAVFYSRLALGPDENRSEPRARRILSESLKEIARLEPSSEDAEERQRFLIKQHSVASFNAGQYLDAYYGFKDLERLDPQDPDLVTFMEYLNPRVAQISFFLDEVTGATEDNVRRNVFFRLPAMAFGPMDEDNRSGSTTTNEVIQDNDQGPETDIFISADQMMKTARGLYFSDFELIELSADGTIVRHMMAPYAKLSGRYMITRAIDRNDASIRRDPTYLRGEPVDGELGVVKIPMNPEEIWAVNPSTPFYSDVDILQLFALAHMYPEYGKNAEFPFSEILYRLLLPFSLVNISLIIIGMAWSGRSRYLGGPPSVLYVFLPVVPVFIIGLYDLYVYLFRNILNAVLILSNVTIAIIVLVSLQALVFILVMMLLVRSSSK